MSMIVQDWQGVGSRPRLRRNRVVDHMAYLAVLVILSAISILVLFVYSIRNAYEHLPERLHVNRRRKCARDSKSEERKLIVVELNFLAACRSSSRTKPDLDGAFQLVDHFLGQTGMLQQMKKCQITLINRDDMLRKTANTRPYP